MAIAPVNTDFVVKKGTVILGDTEVTSSTNQQNSLQVNGGAAVAKNLIVGTTATMGGELYVGSILEDTVVSAIYSNNVVLASYTSPIISSTATVNLDTFSSSVYRTARYTVQVIDGPDIHITEITLFHNDVDVYKNEYGISTNNGQLGRFDANLTDTTVTLTFSPTTATTMTVKVVRLGITA
jgi:hypothetical protein